MNTIELVVNLSASATAEQLHHHVCCLLANPSKLVAQPASTNKLLAQTGTLTSALRMLPRNKAALQTFEAA